MKRAIAQAVLIAAIAVATAGCNGSRNSQQEVTDSANLTTPNDDLNASGSLEEMGPMGGGGGNITANAMGGTDGTGGGNATSNTTGASSTGGSSGTGTTGNTSGR